MYTVLWSLDAVLYIMYVKNNLRMLMYFLHTSALGLESKSESFSLFHYFAFITALVVFILSFLYLRMTPCTLSAVSSEAASVPSIDQWFFPAERPGGGRRTEAEDQGIGARTADAAEGAEFGPRSQSLGRGNDGVQEGAERTEPGRKTKETFD